MSPKNHNYQLKVLLPQHFVVCQEELNMCAKINVAATIIRNSDIICITVKEASNMYICYSLTTNLV